ncbi:MAG: DUF1573 domain-containing protein [Bacteroidia bacterium]|nr:DUF1573 domain-containing protein [Bacteroidia bacterium]
MKKIFLSAFILSAFVWQLNAQTIVDKGYEGTYAVAKTLNEMPSTVAVFGPEITFTKTKHNFGTIKQGVPVKVKFVFENTGNANLVINKATAGCGCTTPAYSKEPIAPGKKSEIEVGYDAKAVGSFVKDVTVETNAGTVKLVITGVVEVEATDNNGGTEIKIPTKK